MQKTFFLGLLRLFLHIFVCFAVANMNTHCYSKNFFFNPLSADITKWSNTLRQFISKLQVNCLSVLDHFVGLVLKGLISLFYFPDEFFPSVITRKLKVIQWIITRKLKVMDTVINVVPNAAIFRYSQFNTEYGRMFK